MRVTLAAHLAWAVAGVVAVATESTLVTAHGTVVEPDLPVVVGTWAVAGFQTAVDEAFEEMAGGRGTPMDAVVAG